MRQRFSIPIVALVLALAMAAGAAAQRRGRFGAPIRTATAASFDGRFNFCRVAFSYSNQGFGGGWSVDYPRADINLSIRLGELTKTAVSTDAAGCSRWSLSTPTSAIRGNGKETTVRTSTRSRSMATRSASTRCSMR